MVNLSVWDIVLFAIAAYLAVVFFVRLMRLHRDRLVAELRKEFDQVVQQKIMERANQQSSEKQLAQIAQAAEMAKVVQNAQGGAASQGVSSQSAAAVERMKQAVSASVPEEDSSSGK